LRWIQLPISRIDPQPIPLPLQTDDHARADALKRLLTLPLRKLFAEKLSQRLRGARVGLGALVASVWVYQSELAKLSPSRLAWLWAEVSPTLLQSGLP
jgi:hypothetical protein